MHAQHQRIEKEGRILETEKEVLAELTEQWTEFHEKRLPVLARLGIA